MFRIAGLLWLCTLWLAPMGWAQTLYYLSDKVSAPLYSKPSKESKVIAQVGQLDRVRILENKQTGWSKVRVNKQVGYIRSSLLVVKPNSQIRLNALQQSFDKHKQQMNALSKELEYLRKQRKQLTGELEQYKKDNYVQLYNIKELERIAKNPLAVAAENSKLLEDNEFLLIENSLLRESDEVEYRSQQRNWIGLLILVGVLALMTGWISGTLQEQRKRQREIF